MKRPITSAADLVELQFNDDGLVPVIAQDQVTGAVLMLAWANQEALQKSLDSRAMTYWSRSRQALWAKGETSGHRQALVSLSADCDGDAVLAVVKQTGPACHEGSGTCWSDHAEAQPATWLGVIDELARLRMAAPAGRYTDTLLADPGLVAEKILEEAGEVAEVLQGKPNDDSLEHEAADLLYHLTVALRGAGSSFEAALRELSRR